MLSDLISSARGPGVIGILIALFVLLGFGFLFTVVDDSASTMTGPNVQFQIKEKQRSIRVQERKMKEIQEDVATYEKHSKQLAELRDVQKSVTLKQAQLEELDLMRIAARADLVKLADQFEGYKKQYRDSERERAVGEAFDVFNTKDGKVYKQVSIRRISALGMEIRHKNGSKRIHFKDLPDEMQDRFQFIQDDADVLSFLENDTVKKADLGKAEYNRTRQEKRNQTLSQNHRANTVRWRAEISRCDARVESNNNEIQKIRSRMSHSHSNGINDSTSTSERKIKVLQRSSSSAKSRIAELSRKISQSPTP